MRRKDKCNFCVLKIYSKTNNIVLKFILTCPRRLMASIDVNKMFQLTMSYIFLVNHKNRYDC